MEEKKEGEKSPALPPRKEKAKQSSLIVKLLILN